MTAGKQSRYLAIAGRTLLGISLLIGLFLFYQLFVTDFINSRSQAAAADELVVVLAQRRDDLTSPSTTTPASTTTTAQVVELPELVVEPEVSVGEPFARLIIDRIALDAVVFEGVDRTTLKSGPGHMPGTPLPGQPGNAVISGHRTTYGRPFYELDLLVVGDEIAVETALGISTYSVREILIVAPTDVWVADNMDGAWLTLTTCHPRFSAAQRLIVQAELIDGPNIDYVEAVAA
ncbi:MAG TPA: class E sortase [Acidimicrobiia bacterium]|nr:class E sortase [Acidimicrobiia bacterium]